MADLPETENEEQKENGEKKRRPLSFTAGFAAGVLTMLVILVVSLYDGDNLLMDLLVGKSGPMEGAEILTSSWMNRKLGEVQKLIDSYYLDEVDSSMLSAYLFRGVAAGLGDDYARYYTMEELNSEQESNQGEYVGIGVTLMELEETGEILVTTVYEGGPAEQAGMQKDDVLIEFNGEPLAGVDLTEVTSMIRGSEGPFELTVLRDGKEVALEMECGQVEKTTVSCEMKEPGIGYIAVTEFGAVTVQQFENAVNSLFAQGAESLIIDLRDNPGGLLTSVCDILDYLLPEGLIVYTEDRDGNREEYTSDDVHSVDCHMAVLVNGNSASASEIFAGAIQDHGMGTIIGTPTYGKGVVQNTYRLSDGSGFKMTIEKYYTPSGQDIDGNGIKPDILVEETADEEDPADAPLQKALEMLGGGKQ